MDHSIKKRAPVKPKLSFKVSVPCASITWFRFDGYHLRIKKSLPILILIKHPKETYDNKIEKIMPAKKMCKNHLSFM